MKLELILGLVMGLIFYEGNFMTAISAVQVSSLPLWNGDAPGEPAIQGEEMDITKPTDALVGGQKVIRLGNVVKPELTFYPAKNSDGTTVVIFPGGGYYILAMDLEGTEVAQWLNSIGINAVLVKYRVPARKGQERYLAPLQDAQRAMRIVRSKAKEWEINPNRIGVIGFSAGAHLCAVLSAQHTNQVYEPKDDIDKLNCRPDFQILIYPAYLTDKNKNDEISPEVVVSNNTPSTFLVQTQDDSIRVENSIYYYLALKRAGVKAELHVFPSGGHGYGLRKGKRVAETWPELVKSWINQL